MALLTGKRKRREEVSDQESHQLLEFGPASPDNLQALFRAHFEAQFAPLEGPSSPRRPRETPEAELAHDESESDWGGISEDEGIPATLIEYKSTEPRKGEVPHGEFKSFMVWGASLTSYPSNM